MKNLTIIFILFISYVFAGLSYATPLLADDYKAFKVEIMGENPAQHILFIPGLGCSAKVWEETAAIFKKSHTCHLLTLAGFAGQPALNKEPLLATIKDQLICYIEHKKLKNVTLVGHSLGGFLSYWIAAERPQLIKKLVAVDGLPFLGGMRNPQATSKSMQPIAQRMKDQMLKSSSKEVAEKNQRRMLQGMINSKKHLEIVLQWNLKSNLKTVAQAMYDLYTIDLREIVANITAPTLVMGVWWGREYGTPLKNIRQTYAGQIKKIPHHQLLIHETAKHFLMYDDKDWFINQLQKFLKQ